MGLKIAMEGLFGIAGLMILAQGVFLLLAIGAWLLRRNLSARFWFQFPFVCGATAAALSALFPVTELAVNIGPAYMSTCLTYTECSDAVIKSAVWILAAIAQFCIQLFVYYRSIP